jgi:serine/threonine protein kinase
MVSNYESESDFDTMVKIIDFGMSFTPQKGKKVCMNTYAGTVDFMAPEII